MLSATKKGLLVGLTNLLVIGVLIGLDVGVRHLPGVMGVIVVIGAGPALGVGALCGWLGGRLPSFRRLALITLPMTIVTSLGVLSDPSLIAPAVLPTFLGSLALEYWTRANLATCTPTPLTPTLLGLLLGVTNVAVVAIVLAIYVTRIEPRHVVGGITIHPPFGLHFAALVMCLGAIPGAVVGALSGFLATRLRDYSTLTRFAGISSVAVSGVFALGSLADAPTLVLPALLPTLFVVDVLERRTRPIEAVPGARALRGA